MISDIQVDDPWAVSFLLSSVLLCVLMVISLFMARAEQKRVKAEKAAPGSGEQ